MIIKINITKDITSSMVVNMTCYNLGAMTSIMRLSLPTSIHI
jgi:hypothetical protein